MQSEPLATPFPVAIDVDSSAALTPLRPIHRFIGCDEPNFAYSADGKKTLAMLGKLGPTTTFFRAHNLMTSGDGLPALKWGSTNLYTESADGSPIYDFTLVDRIFDTYLAAKVKPYVQLGFMPEALSVKPSPYRHHWTPAAKYDEIYTGWAYPPRDFKKWGEVCFRWVEHCVARYGRSEVEKWYFETWNEPNIGYWRGTPDEFLRLHDHAIAAVRRALPTARVGGSDVAGSGGNFQRRFFEHCLRGANDATGQTGTPLDFVSFHAKGAPTFLENHVRMGIANQLRTIDEGFGIIASYPELKDKPIVIGESDPDGCAACQGPQLGYRNGTLYASYTAASFYRKHLLAEKHGVHLEGALTWAFLFDNQPWFAGFRVVSDHGLALPVLNALRMMGQLGGERVSAKSTGETPLAEILKDGVRSAPDVAALASREKDRTSILVWHYHDDDIEGADADVALTVRGLGGRDMKMAHFRIDNRHSNVYTAWKAMGAPQSPSSAQKKRLEAASALAKLTGSPDRVPIESGAATLRFTLPRQGISLIVLG